MKKFLIITGSILVVLILALVLIPFLFKGKIVEGIKQAANENLNATLNFENIGLTFFKNFPDFTLNLEKLTIVNKAPFEGDTLVDVNSFQIIVDLMSLIKGDTYRIVSIKLDQPDIFMHVLKNGEGNWNITKETKETAAAPDTAAGGLNFALQNYQISNGHVVVQNDSTNSTIEVSELNHEGSGDFTKDMFTLKTATELNLTMQMGGVNYFKEVAAALDAEIEMDLKNAKYTVRKNELRLKNISLAFDGFVQMPEGSEDITVDLTFDAKQTDFKDFMELIPAVYLKDFENVKTAGKLALNGKIKGVYSKKAIPGFDIRLNVENGMLETPDIPTSVKNVNIDFAATNPGGDADQSVIQLKKLHFEIANEPFTADMLLKNPLSDPSLKAGFEGRLNLGNIKNFLNLEEGTSVSGIIRTNLKVDGKISDIKKNNAKAFKALGDIEFVNIAYQASSLPEKISVRAGKISFTPQQINLDQFDAKIGDGDVKAKGRLDNLLPYVMKDNQVLKGWLTLNSNFFNLNPWMSDESSQLEAVELPANIEFYMNADFKKVLYDNLELENVIGKLTLKDQILKLDGLNMNLLNGSMIASGTYDAHTPKNPQMNFDLKVSQFSFAKAFEKFVTVQKFAPMAQFMEGDFNAQFNLNSKLDNKLMPVWSSVKGLGKIDIKKATIKGFEPLNKVAEAVKFDALKNPALNNINPNFKIDAGRFILDPFDMQVQDAKINVQGSNGIDKSIDYALAIDLPASKFKGESASFVNQLFGSQSNLDEAETVKFNVGVGGTITNPKITTSVKDVVKSAVEKKVDQKKEDLKKEAEKKILDLIKPKK
jgi:hypothetical protein